MSRLQKLNSLMLKGVKEVEKEIVRLFNEKGITILCTDKADCDTMYVAIYEGDELVEREVKGVMVENDQVYVCLDIHCVKYTEEDLKKHVENDEWIPLTGGDMALFYAYVLAESLEEYL